MLNLARETLGSDLLLPQFVNIINRMNQDVSQLKTKAHTLEFFKVLIDESATLQGDEDTYIQFAAVTKTLGNLLQYHNS